MNLKEENKILLEKNEYLRTTLNRVVTYHRDNKILMPNEHQEIVHKDFKYVMLILGIVIGFALGVVLI